MKKFIYCTAIYKDPIDTTPFDPSLIMWQGWLSMHGEQGWQLVHAEDNGTGVNDKLCTFMRETE